MSRVPLWGRWLIGLTILRAMFAIVIPPTPEEAYHWAFGVRLDWSYYDHPGMIAWSIALGRALFGDVPFAIRFVPLFFASGTAALLARLATKLYGDRAALWAVLLLTIQPVTFITAASGYPDSPMLFFWALTMSLVWEALESGRGIFWIPAGAALGLGMISKYTIVFFGVSMVFYLLTSKRDRRWLATPWPYLAAILALVVFTPVTWWNAHHDWASIRFQGRERFHSANEFNPIAFAKFLGMQWGGVVPFTLPLAAMAVWRTARSSRPEEKYLFWCFAPMMAFFAAVSWRMPTHMLWPLPAWLGITVIMAGMISEAADRVSKFYARAGSWIAGASLVLLLFGLLHMAVFFPQIPMPSAIHGWPVVAERVKQLRAELPEGSFILGLGRKYNTTALLAWHLRAPFDVTGETPLGESSNQYDLWTDLKKLDGRDAAVLLETWRGSETQKKRLAKAFRSVEPAGDLVVPLPGGAPLRFTLYRARGYIPTPLPRRATSSATPDTPQSTPARER
jgi:4-amino-4-deoxy-L-arabinose transferase-like glycosyltransferase